jgi:lipocalin-like protein
MSFTRAGDLLGAWRLESAVEVFDDGERRDEFGPSPEGYLCYNPAGIVSATLGDSGRPPIPAGDPQSGTDSDYGKMARRFIAYAGPFSADPGNGTVTHHVDASLFPNWQGHDQARRVTIEGRRLSIIASDRTSADGRTFHSEHIWLKA